MSPTHSSGPLAFSIVYISQTHCLSSTLEPLNRGHVGTKSFVLYKELFFIWRLKCTGIVTSNFVLYRVFGVSFIGGYTVLLKYKLILLFSPF